jgi:hypothetical protein
VTTDRPLSRTSQYRGRCWSAPTADGQRARAPAARP